MPHTTEYGLLGSLMASMSAAHSTCVVASDSMAPAIRVGDCVIVGPRSRQVKIGEVVVSAFFFPTDAEKKVSTK